MTARRSRLAAPSVVVALGLAPGVHAAPERSGTPPDRSGRSASVGAYASAAALAVGGAGIALLKIRRNRRRRAQPDAELR